MKVEGSGRFVCGFGGQIWQRTFVQQGRCKLQKQTLSSNMTSEGLLSTSRSNTVQDSEADFVVQFDFEGLLSSSSKHKSRSQKQTLSVQHDFRRASLNEPQRRQGLNTSQSRSKQRVKRSEATPVFKLRCLSHSIRSSVPKQIKSIPIQTKPVYKFQLSLWKQSQLFD